MYVVKNARLSDLNDAYSDASVKTNHETTILYIYTMIYIFRRALLLLKSNFYKIF